MSEIFPKAIVVFDLSGNPLPNVLAILGNIQAPLTNPDGYALFPENYSSTQVALQVIADGFKNYLKVITLTDFAQNIYVGKTSGNPNDINLPPLTFNKPSRDSIINVKANFCNLFDATGCPIFDGFIDELIINDEARANNWVDVLKAARTTHITLDLSGDYNENLGWAERYPIAGHDWSNDLDGFGSIIDWVVGKGFIPIIKLAFDGQGFDPNGLTYGWSWGIDNLERIVNGLSDYVDTSLWSTGWDGCFPNWTRDQTIQMLRLMRNVLGPNACIDTEFAGPGSVGYCHMGNGAGDWTPDVLGILDNFSIEVMTYPANSDGVQQTAARLLSQTQRKNIQPQNDYDGWYLSELTKKINICYFEDIAYQAIRKQVSAQNAIKAAQFGQNFGFSSFGNGQP